MDDHTPGIYVHIPFCGDKCPYCDFYSVSGTDEAGRFARALETEIDLYSGRITGAGSLYIGGGTPSVLDPVAIGRIVEKATKAFDLSVGAEVTVEVNPEDVAAEKLDVYRQAGINRISIGVQSFCDDDLVFLGRRHDATAAERAIRLSIEAGFETIGMDLIFGFAGHTARRWLETLGKAVRLRPHHISCYQLSVKDSTPLGERKERGENVEQGEEIQRELFLAGSRCLTGEGYIHYEVSNFALGKGNVSRHNTRYWNHAPYLGLGPSAHSFDGEKRWWNAGDLESYCNRTEAGEQPVEGSEELSPEQLRTERLMLGLRTSLGVPIDLIEEFGGGRDKLKALESEALVRIEGDHVVPTVEGFLLADRLPLPFIQD
jgi:oxygen-independent coproporphyrinogen-3 oxidase